MNKISSKQIKLINELIKEINNYDPNWTINLLENGSKYKEINVDEGINLILQLKNVKEEKRIESLKKRSKFNKKSGMILGSILKIREAIVHFNDFLDENRYEKFILFSHIGLNRLFLFIKIERENSWKDFNEKSKVESFDRLLISLLYFNVITKEQKKFLEKLDDRRDQIVHRILFSKDSVSDADFNFCAKIVQIFNELVADIDSKFLIKEKIINFQEGYANHSKIISSINEMEKFSKENEVILGTNHLTSETIVKARSKFISSSRISKQLMSKYSKYFSEGEKFGSSYEFHLFRKKFNIVKNTSGEVVKSIGKEFNTILYDNEYFIKDEDETKKLRYSIKLVEIFGDYIKSESLKGKSFTQVVEDLKAELIIKKKANQ